MTDIVDTATRSRMMSGIRGRNTKPELTVRRMLFARGYRFRLHKRDLPGRPDIVLSKHRVVINVNGCFWHGHDGCHLFRLPLTRTQFWKTKIAGNIERDRANAQALVDLGWRYAVVWECAMKGRRSLKQCDLEKRLFDFLSGSAVSIQIAGTDHPQMAEVLPTM